MLREWYWNGHTRIQEQFGNHHLQVVGPESVFKKPSVKNFTTIYTDGKLPNTLLAPLPRLQRTSTLREWYWIYHPHIEEQFGNHHLQVVGPGSGFKKP